MMKAVCLTDRRSARALARGTYLEGCADRWGLGLRIDCTIPFAGTLRLVHWLVSDSSQLVTGQTIAVDGGTVMH